MPGLSAQDARELMTRLATRGLTDLSDDKLRTALVLLARQGLVVFRTNDGTTTIRALSDTFTLDAAPIDPARPLRLSRFAYLKAGSATMELRSPVSDRYLEFTDPQAAAIFADFQAPLAPERCRSSDGAGDTVPDVIQAMADGRFLLPCDADGQTEEDRRPALQMWEFHDLLLHTRSRRGRRDGARGGTFDFRGAVAEPPAVAPLPPAATWVDLPTPAAPLTRDLIAVLHQRRSVRDFAAAPVPLAKLSAFLDLGLRRRPADSADRPGDRRYPNGGALYEQSFYLAVERVAGLERGLYVYDDVTHRLGLLRAASPALNELLDDSAWSMGRSARPPVAVTITSRFARVRWKYNGLAYALQLKNAGVILERMYLTATTIGLGGCALGNGNTELFCRLAGVDQLDEGPIAEFALGVPAVD